MPLDFGSDCRTCDHMGADPDGAYCVSKNVIQLRIAEPGAHKEYPFGLDINRADHICRNKFHAPRDPARRLP